MIYYLGTYFSSSLLIYSFFLDAPGAPGKPDCKSRDRDHIEIQWTPPRNDGGNPIQGYIIERRELTSKRREWTPLERGNLQRVMIVYI